MATDNYYDNAERNYADAARFRDGVHEEALLKARQIDPAIRSVVDRNPVDSYFRSVWEYPGAWYLYVSIPEKYESRDALVNEIVRNTLALHRGQS